MEVRDYEVVIGKLVILKLFLTKPYRDIIDDVIESLENEYLEKKI